MATRPNTPKAPRHPPQKLRESVHLGFEVGTGAPVSIPITNTFVCGQTQRSGKTTTLEAIVTRANRRALVFATKRGETLHGRTIPPFLPTETGGTFDWPHVEQLLQDRVGSGVLPYRDQLITAVKGE